MNQRFLRLAFSQAAGRLTVTAPSVAEIAPPGHYMLFVLNAAGVPSIAPIVRLNSGPAPTAPAAPTSVSATAVSSSQINLTWTDNASNESGFQIERSTDASTFTEIGVSHLERHDLCQHIVERCDSILVPRSRLQRDGALCLCRPGERDDHAGATTVTATICAHGSDATRQSGRITLTWTDSSNNETGFSIERSPDGQAFSQIATVAQNVSTYVDTSPGSTKFVFYRVRAFNLAGNSAYTTALKVRNR